MIATPDTIWQVPAYLPYLQPPLTDQSIAAAEMEIGYRLPCEYLDLIRKQNGGYIRYSLPESPHDSIAGIGPHFPSLTRFDWEDFQEHVSYPLKGLVPFDGDGHWYLCLDYRKNPQTPSITHAEIECDRETHIADSFLDYLAILRVNVDDEYVLGMVADIDELTTVLCRVLSVRMDPPDTWAYGYPTHRARVGSGDDPQWLWVSPNTVPRGFVRIDDRRYAELKDLMPGFSERYPGLPDNSYLLSATDGVRERVVNACDVAGLNVRPLRDYLDSI